MDKLNKIDFYNMDSDTFIEHLKTISTQKKKEFDMRLIPDTPFILGAKIPDLRKIASSILLGDYEKFLKNVCSDCHEVMLVRGIVIARCKKRDEYLDEFALSVYNWAICDTVANSFTKVDDALYQKLLTYLKSEKPFTVRLGVVGLLSKFIKEKPVEILHEVKQIKVEAETVKMAVGWLLSVAYVYSPEVCLQYLSDGSFDEQTVKIAFSKIRDSFRVSKEETARLRQILFTKGK